MRKNRDGGLGFNRLSLQSVVDDNSNNLQYIKYAAKEKKSPPTIHKLATNSTEINFSTFHLGLHCLT